MSAQLRASTGVRPAGVNRTAVRPLAVAVPRSTRLPARDVTTRAQDKNTVAAIAVSAEPITQAVSDLDPATFNDFLQQHSHKLVIVDFYTDWCGPCKMIAPEIERMARQNDPSKVVFAKLNCGATNDSKKLAVALGIKALPTFHLYRDAKMASMMTGAKIKALEDLIGKHA